MQEEQAAYRTGRQVQDHICTLRTVINSKLMYGKDVYTAFLDLSAAFDSVNREEIWEILDGRKVPNKLLRAIKSVYKNAMGIVRANGVESEFFPFKIGLKQGDSLSPLLFILLIDDITKECNNKCRSQRLKVGHLNLIPIYVQALTYADDIVILADSEEKLQTTLNVWSNELKRRKLHLNQKKSKVMHFTKDKEQRKPKIVVDGEELEVVQQFTYLGTVFQANGKITEEIKNRISKASNIYYQLNKTVIGKPEVGKEAKLQIYKSIYQPTLLYGAETWARTTKTDGQIEAAEMKFLRRVAGKTKRDMARSSRIREELNQQHIIKQLETKQLKWYGHVQRMPDERQTKKCVEARPWGKRPKGRPRKTWMDCLKEVGKKKNLSEGEMKKLSKDRKKWKQFCRGP